MSKKLTIDNIKKLYKTFKGYGEAKKIIKEFKPDVVIGTGGYICGATISAAHSLGIPTLLHVSNAFPGKAVKMLAKKTDTILVSFKDAEDRIKKAKKIVFTGTPVKIVKKDYGVNEKLNIVKNAGLDEIKPIVLIFGGSQGAQKINEAVLGILQNKLNKNYQIMWATGPKQYDIIKQQLQDQNISINNITNAKIIPYIYNMEEIMNVSDVIVARSGAMTITEISNTGKPAVFIPFPFATENHQEYNARVLVNEDAAKIILDKDLNEETLSSVLNEILKDKSNLLKMGQNAEKIAIKDVEEKIFKEIKRLVK